MADRYTEREEAIVTVLTANLASTYSVSNKDSINLGSGTRIHNVLVHWEGFGNDLGDGDCGGESDREKYRIICTPLSGVLNNDSNTQCNKMAAEVVDVLRNSVLISAATIDPGETLTEFQVSAADKGHYQKRLSVQISFSFLADE